MTPKVSVLVPVYNVAGYLRECLTSLVEQTLDSLEIICVNDGSTDESLEILREYEARFPSVTVIDKPNEGYGVAMNTALKVASGEYIGIVESDDFADPNMFEVLYSIASMNDADAVKSNHYRYTSFPKPHDVFSPVLNRCRYYTPFCPRDEPWIFFAAPSIWSGLYKRSFLDEFGIRFTETPGASFQDTAFNFKVWASAERAVAIESPFLHYRVDNEGSSVKSKEKVNFVNTEYAEIQRFLNRYPEWIDELQPVVCAMKMKAYTWNIERLALEYRRDYYNTVIEEFARDQSSGRLLVDYLSKDQIVDLRDSLENPESHFERKYGGKGVDASIVLYVDSHGTGLKKTVESIRSQSNSSFEVLCVPEVDSREIQNYFMVLTEKDERFKLAGFQDCIADSLTIRSLSGAVVLFLKSGQILDCDALENLREQARGSASQPLIEWALPDGVEFGNCEGLLAGYYQGHEYSFIVGGVTEIFESMRISYNTLSFGILPLSFESLPASGFFVPKGERRLYGSVAFPRETMPDLSFCEKYEKERGEAYRLCSQLAGEAGIRQAFDCYASKIPEWMHVYKRRFARLMGEEDGTDWRCGGDIVSVDYCGAASKPRVIKPMVSIIVSDHHEKVSYALRCIDSILNQTIEDIEIICVTSCALDGHVDAIRAIPLEARSLTIVNLLSDKGSGNAFNIGMHYAIGRNIAFFDSGCQYVSTRAVEYLLNQLECGDYVASSCEPTFFDGNCLEARSYYKRGRFAFGDEVRELTFSKEQDELFLARYMFRRSFIDEHNLRFSGRSYLDDIVFASRALDLAGSYLKTSMALVEYRASAGIVWPPKKATEMQVHDAIEALGELLEFSSARGYRALHTQTLMRFVEEVDGCITDMVDSPYVLEALVSANAKIDSSLVDSDNRRFDCPIMLPQITLLSEFVTETRVLRRISALGNDDEPEVGEANAKGKTGKLVRKTNGHKTLVCNVVRKELEGPDISVIIPVYNKSETLGQCIDSLFGQTIDKRKVEIVIVDDGSTDDSLELCRALEEKHDNVKLISQSNSGVSHARNIGIRNSEGRYLCFLDADDYLEPQTLENLVSSFEAFGEQIDVITYPIFYWNPDTDDMTTHKRETWLKSTGVYDLSRYFKIAQTTMNIAIRREALAPALFDTELAMGEDQLFITRHLARKSAIGFCKEAGYVYRRDGSGESSFKNYPLFAFAGMIKLFNEFLGIADEYPSMASYVHQMILYNIGWRVESGMLYPEFGDSDTRARNYELLAEVMRAIPVDAYDKTPYIDANHKVYLLERFGMMGHNPRIGVEEKRLSISAPFGAAIHAPFPVLRILRAIQHGDRIVFYGYMICSAFLFFDKPIMEIDVNGTVMRAELTRSSYDRYKSREVTTRAWNVSFSLPTPKESLLSATFVLKISDTVISDIKMRFPLIRKNCAYFDDGIQHWVFPDCEMTASDSLITLKPITEDLIARLDSQDDEYTALRTRVRRAREGASCRIWLYADLPWSMTSGNALVQILHDCAIDDGIKRFYITEHSAELLETHPELKGHLVDYQSDDHLAAFVNAEMIMASYLEWPTYYPCHRSELSAFSDLVVQKSYVYLQHGILHAQLPWLCSYDRTRFDYEVVSTNFEIDNLTSNYLFNNDQLITSGAPRMDLIETLKADSKKIVYIPSWRGYLDVNKLQDADSRFENSAFYAGCKHLISLIEESGVLERYDYKFEIKLHPNFESYSKFFKFESERVSLAPSTIDEADYQIAITDFSSYVYDFVYAGSKVIYFIPDKTEVDAGMNHYSAIDWPFGDGFGASCGSADEVVEQLELLLSGRAGKEYLDKYKARRERFFLHQDGKNTMRLYEELKAIADRRRAPEQSNG